MRSIQALFFISLLWYCNGKVQFAFKFLLNSFQDRFTSDLPFAHLFYIKIACQCKVFSILKLASITGWSPSMVPCLIQVSNIWTAAVLSINSSVLILFLIGKAITGFPNALSYQHTHSLKTTRPLLQSFIQKSLQSSGYHVES